MSERGTSPTAIESHWPMPRQARLRPEAADKYPGVPVGKWYLAEVMVEMVWASLLRAGRASFITGERILTTGHFEFRYGEPFGRITSARRRAGDSVPDSSEQP